MRGGRFNCIGKHSGQPFLTPRRIDRRLLKILIARVEKISKIFFFDFVVIGWKTLCILKRKSNWGIATSVFHHSQKTNLESKWFIVFLWAIFLVSRQFIPNSIVFMLFVWRIFIFVFLNHASVWIDPYQKPHQVSKVNSLWPIKVNVVKGSRQNRLVSSVEGLAL